MISPFRILLYTKKHPIKTKKKTKTKPDNIITFGNILKRPQSLQKQILATRNLKKIYWFLFLRAPFLLYHGHSFHRYWWFVFRKNFICISTLTVYSFHANYVLHYLSIFEVANIPNAIVLLPGHFPRTAFWDIGDRTTQPVPTNDKWRLIY